MSTDRYRTTKATTNRERAAVKQKVWPRRYRLAHRVHCRINRLDRKAGHHPVTAWMNDKAAGLWIPWWMSKGRFMYDHRGMRGKR